MLIFIGNFPIDSDSEKCIMLHGFIFLVGAYTDILNDFWDL
jgi:hypothetical protein